MWTPQDSVDCVWVALALVCIAIVALAFAHSASTTDRARAYSVDCILRGGVAVSALTTGDYVCVKAVGETR